MAWRAFTGLAGEWAWTDVTCDTWVQARLALATELEPFRTDECAECRQRGTDALARLHATPEGEPFEAEVDGHDYTLSAV